MDAKLNPLFTPWKIGNVEIKNRIVMTSMGGTSLFGWMEPTHFDKEAANFILERAKNNVGLILPGIAPILNPMLGGWLYQNKGMYKKLKVFMEEVHKTGAKLFVQLTGGFGRAFAVSDSMEIMGKSKIIGFIAKPIINLDRICASASPNPNRWSDHAPSRALTVKEIKKMVDAFAKTAKLCKDAGVDGVEIHAVHEGYLLDQFTLKYCNQRKDEYGGSFENRYRFPVEIVQAIKKVCGKDYPVSLRYSVVSKTKGFRQGALPGEKYKEVGRDMEESEKAAKYLQDAGYDMLNCDNGTYDAWYWSHPPMYMPENCNLDDVAHIKNFVDIPVVAAGRMNPIDSAEAIKEGRIDAMGVARPFLADAAWVTKMMNGKDKDIRPCIYCHNGCFNLAHSEGHGNNQSLTDATHMARCAVNAETMQTNKHFIKPAKVKKNIAVVGGGIGGMEVARIATLRGHKVTIYEKADKLGGVFNFAAAPSFKEHDKKLLAWYNKQMKDLKVTVKLKTEVKDIASLKADEVIIATGSKARTIRLPGIEKAIEACDYLGGKEVGENPIIIGGGLTGCEIAYDLCLKGKKPTIVEMQNDLITQKGICLANSSYLREYFALTKTPVLLNTKAKEITDKGIVAIDKDGKEIKVKGDSVIVSAGYIPTPLVKKGSHIHLVGDCDGVGNVRTVVWQAYETAMKL